MVPEDLLFWIAPLDDAPGPDPNVLCRRHADAMVVPRGWTLDDRREEFPRLFRPRQAQPAAIPVARRKRHRHDDSQTESPEQLQIDGTGEIARPDLSGDEPADQQPDATEASVAAGPRGVAGGDYQPWQPEFDTDDDLGGLLEVTSPLLARAFRGTDRPRP
jgi:hypothetical protein